MNKAGWLGLLSVVPLTVALSGCDIAADTQGPRIVITSVVEGDPMSISGRLEDETVDGLTLTANGTVANITDKNFSVEIERADLYEFLSSDSLGNVASTTYHSAPAADDIETLVTARINDSGINFVEDEVTSFVADQGFLQEFANKTYTLIDAVAGLLAAKATITEAFYYDDPFNINTPPTTWAEQGDLTIEVTPLPSTNENGRVAVHVELNKAKLSFNSTLTLLFTFAGPSGSFWIDRATLDGEAQITANGELKLVVGTVTAPIQTLGRQVGSSDFSQAILEGMVDLANNFIEEQVAEKVKAVLTETVDEFLAGVSFTNEFTLTDGTLSLATLPADVATDEFGMTAWMAGNALPVTDGEVPTALGYRYATDALPVVTDSTPGGLPFDISGVVSSNFLNQVLLAAYQSGATDLSLSYTGGEFDFTGSGLGGQIGDNDNITVEVIPSNSAYVEMGGEHDLGAVGLNNFEFQFWQNGEWKFTAIVDAEVSLNQIGLTSDSFIQVDVDSRPDILVTEFVAQNNGDWNIDVVNFLVDLVVPLAMPVLVESIEGIQIASFAEAGYGVNMIDSWAEGENRQHLAAAANLVSVDVTADAPAPTTYVSLAPALDVVDNGELPEVVWGEVSFQLSGENPGTEPLQYRHRLDGGNWSAWSPQTLVTIRTLVGEHQLEVCSRTELLKEDSECALLDFTVQ